MLSRCAFALSVTLCSTLSLATFVQAPARAQVQDVEMPPSEVAARGHYLMGREHYDAGRFAEAALEFQQAYDLSRRPQLLLNLFLAHRDAGHTRDAAVALRRYLADVPDAPQREVLRGRLATLEAQLAADEARAREASAREASAREASAQEASAREAGDTGSATTEPSTGGGSVGPWVVIGVGGALAIAAIVTGALAASTHGELSASCPDGICPAGYDLEGNRSSGATLALTTDVLGGVSAAALAAGIVWAIVDATQGSPSEARTQLQCSPLGCRGRF